MCDQDHKVKRSRKAKNGLSHPNGLVLPTTPQSECLKRLSKKSEQQSYSGSQGGHKRKRWKAGSVRGRTTLHCPLCKLAVSGRGQLVLAASLPPSFRYMRTSLRKSFDFFISMRVRVGKKIFTVCSASSGCFVAEKWSERAASRFYRGLATRVARAPTSQSIARFTSSNIRHGCPHIYRHSQGRFQPSEGYD